MLKPRILAPFLFIFLILSLFIFLSSIHSQTTLSEQNQQDFVRMADNFFIIYDPSTSMDKPYKDTGLSKLEVQKNIIRESNLSLPELNWQAGLYAHWKPGLQLPGSPYAHNPYYRLQNYDQKKFAEAIEMLPTIPTGPPMLQVALMELEHMLGIAGQTHVFIFSTGEDSRFEGVDEPEPLAQTRKLAKMYDVCFNIISNARGVKEKKLLAEMAAVNPCSQLIDFDTVAMNPEYLLGKLYANINNMFNNILFDFDKVNIKKEYRNELNKLGRFLIDNQKSHIILSGFTDSIGSKEYNINLSKRRAMQVRNYLTENFKIKNERILLYWYGYSNPVASNDTPEGRGLNRRVTISVKTK